jgi:hypothetical protein
MGEIFQRINRRKLIREFLRFREQTSQIPIPNSRRSPHVSDESFVSRYICETTAVGRLADMKNYSCRYSDQVLAKLSCGVWESGIVIECDRTFAVDAGVVGVNRALDLRSADAGAEEDFVEEGVAVSVVDGWCWWLMGWIRCEGFHCVFED